MKELIDKKDFETLHSYDQVPAVSGGFCQCWTWWAATFTAVFCPQLKKQIDEEAVFVGFVEGDIEFQPTYKYDTGTDLWDTR